MSVNLSEKIKSLAKQHKQETIATRKHLHANPELSYKEFKTAKFVAEKLKSFGLEPEEGVADTGVVALIKGGKSSGKTIALRADLDALPIVEANNVEYKSKNEGVMHACGHDAHTASLLGTAQILTEIKEELKGDVKLIFQPGEEKQPGGASLMIKAGVLENPKPISILGQHVTPDIEAGKVGFRKGMYMASADEIYVTVKGKGGHGAIPEDCVDPVLITSHIIVALQQIVSRMSSPKIPTVLTFGKVIANGATNVIPNEVKIEGTFRTFNEEWRAEAHKSMKKMATSIAEGMGGSCDFDIQWGYPYLVNEPNLTGKMHTAATAYLGAENVIDLDLRLAAEDFSFYSHQVDACFYRFGTGNKNLGITSGVHTPTFDIDHEALETGSGMMSWLAVNALLD